MKLAAIDIGTNSTRLLICDANPLPDIGKIELLLINREMQITRLGKNLERTGKISIKQAMETIDVLKKYNELMEKNSVKKFRAVGTRVFRYAKNVDWFISEVKGSTGIDIEIISGEQEAELSFEGAVQSIDMESVLKTADRVMNQDKNVLVLDVGGGSTEFMLGSIKGRIVFCRSIEDGSVSVTEKFLDEDKPKSEDIERLKAYINKRFSTITKRINETGFLSIIGLAGTITTLAAIDLKLSEYDREEIHRYSLRLEKIRKILLNFCSTSLKDRQNIVGLDPRRADIIIGGTVILIEIMELLKQDKILVSESDILDGIIYSIF
jgi:exopolyphosphatase/guanosine-5'-triphosphate,3'-diphosphate pyrophosphatase